MKLNQKIDGCLLALALGLLGQQGAAQAKLQPQIVVSATGTGRIFDGLGAASAGASSRLLVDYPEPQRNQILDYLFKPDYGAALERLKVEIGGDVNSTDGSEASHMRSPEDHDASRGYEFWLMAEAHKRNPKIQLEVLAWGAPGWVGKGTLYTRAMAAYVADFIRTAEKEYGLHIDYAGTWNEKQHDLAYVGYLAEELKKAGLDTKIVCCDETAHSQPWKIAAEMKKNPVLATQVAAIGAHYPVMDGPVLPDEAARTIGRPLWSSEDQPNSGSGPFVSRDWSMGGMILARLYNRNYIDGAMTATEIWSPVTSYYDNLPAPNSGLMYANTPWSGYYKVQGAIWATAHTTQFAEPGWQYVDAACGKLAGSGSYVTLRAPDQKNWSMVLETINARQGQKLSFRLADGVSAEVVYVWETSDTHTFERVAVLHPQDGEFAFTFEPNSLYSLTTTTGQARGLALPPAESAFPLPYRDDFELQRSNHLPLYLSDQDGAFELVPCVRRAGQCLEQRITEKPVEWMLLPKPYTIAGDQNWADYRVVADVFFLSQSPVMLMGRIDAADGFVDRNMDYPSGYGLRVRPTGEWELISTAVQADEQVLAQGKITLEGQQWHKAALSFDGDTINAQWDGKLLATVQDDTHTNGMFALATEWQRAQFDNLEVSKVQR